MMENIVYAYTHMKSWSSVYYASLPQGEVIVFVDDYSLSYPFACHVSLVISIMYSFCLAIMFSTTFTDVLACSGELNFHLPACAQDDTRILLLSNATRILVRKYIFQAVSTRFGGVHRSS